jgi:hypothetical protein
MLGSIVNMAASAFGGASGAGGDSGGGIDAAKNAMNEAFNTAIQNSAEITALTTERKVELDAAKQRPNI